MFKYIISTVLLLTGIGALIYFLSKNRYLYTVCNQEDWFE